MAAIISSVLTGGRECCAQEGERVESEAILDHVLQYQPEVGGSQDEEHESDDSCRMADIAAQGTGEGVWNIW